MCAHYCTKRHQIENRCSLEKNAHPPKKWFKDDAKKKGVRQTPTPNIKLKDADLFTDWKKFTDNSKMKQT